jgi:hypothetical protein
MFFSRDTVGDIFETILKQNPSKLIDSIHALIIQDFHFHLIPFLVEKGRKFGLISVQN